MSNRVERTPLSKRVATETYVRTFMPFVEKISKSTCVDYAPGFWRSVDGHIANHDLLVLIPGHDSLHNGPTVSLVTNDLTLRARESGQDFPGFVVPVAKSLIDGGQGYFLQRLFQEVEKKILNKNHLYVVKHTRIKDQEVYGTSPNRMEYMEEMRMKIGAGYGVMIFPEGEAGRGMTNFKRDSLPVIIKLAQREGRQPVFIPVGVSGDPKVFYTSKVPTLEAVRAGLQMNDGALIDVRVGMPIALGEIDGGFVLDRNPGNIARLNQFLGEKVAELLPEEERGVFGQKRVAGAL